MTNYDVEYVNKIISINCEQEKLIAELKAEIENNDAVVTNWRECMEVSGKANAELEEENETLFSNSTNNTARWINRKIEFKAKIAELESLLQELRDSGEWYLTALQFEVDGLKLKDKVDKVLG